MLNHAHDCILKARKVVYNAVARIDDRFSTQYIRLNGDLVDQTKDGHFVDPPRYMMLAQRPVLWLSPLLYAVPPIIEDLHKGQHVQASWLVAASLLSLGVYELGLRDALLRIKMGEFFGATYSSRCFNRRPKKNNRGVAPTQNIDIANASLALKIMDESWQRYRIVTTGLIVASLGLWMSATQSLMDMSSPMTLTIGVLPNEQTKPVVIELGSNKLMTFAGTILPSIVFSYLSDLYLTRQRLRRAVNCEWTIDRISPREGQGSSPKGPLGPSFG